MTANILSIGECMGEFSQAGERLYRFGYAGDTLNTAWYLRALTDASRFNVDYLTAVGTDRLSGELVEFLLGNGIGTARIRRISDRTIGLYIISLKAGERSFTYWRDASAARLLAQDLPHLQSCIAAADCIYFSGVTLAILSARDRGNLLEELRLHRKAGKTIAFDSNIRWQLWRTEEEMRSVLTAAYGVSTVALPSFDDESKAFGNATPEAVAARIADCGVAEVIVKSGGGRCLVLSNDTLVSVPPEPVSEIVDTTGAGDSFNGGYLAARLTGQTPESSTRLAHRVAARVIAHPGALVEMHRFADLRP